MEKPIIAGKEPIMLDLKRGETYSWCSCGRSKDQPFCDGSHEGTSFEPLSFTAENDGEVALCTCKLTKTPPYCDGTHLAIK